MASSLPQPETSLYPPPSAEGAPEIYDGIKNVPGYPTYAIPPPPPEEYGYIPPPVNAGQYATTTGMYPTGYPPDTYGHEATAPEIIPSPTANTNESFNWGIFAGGICAGFLLSLFGFLFLLCLELSGKKKKAFVIGCAVGLAINLIVAVAVPIIFFVVFAASFSKY